MSRKNIIIIITLILLLFIGGLVGGYFYLTTTRVVETEDEVGGVGSLAESGQLLNTENTLQTTSADGIIPRLRQITQTPVAGYDFVDTPSGTVIWYVDRATGNVLQTATSTFDITRITNTTIPKVYEAHIGKGGANIILRVLNESTGNIQTFIGSPKAKTSTSTDSVKDLVGTFTGDSISFLGLAPAKDRFFGMVNGLGNIYQMTGRSTNSFSSPLTRWIPQWASDATIVMTSAPSARTQNLSYLFNVNTKAFTKIIGPKNGLITSASPDALRVIFSENKNNLLETGLYDVRTGTQTALNNETIPDKCVWSKLNKAVVYCAFPKTVPGGLYPDDWYKGKVFFNDTISSLNTTTFEFDTYSDLEAESGNILIDATNLMLSKDENYLLFTNKRDLTLWVLEL